MSINEIKTKVDKYPILFLLAIAVGVRLYNINSPIIGIHSWRQADTAAIARNFYENGFNLFYPQVDWGGNSPGYCETEFPIYSFIVSILYKFFGVHELFGRLTSIVFSLLTILFLYKLTTKYFDRQVAFWSCLLFAILPLNVYYSRTFQPESMLLMCTVAGIYYFINWLESNKVHFLSISAFFVSLSCLIKVLPILYIGMPLLYLAWHKFKIKIFTNIYIFLYTLFILITFTLWYYHAHQLFLEYGNTFGFWGGSTNRYQYSMLLTVNFWSEIIFRTSFRHFAIFMFPIFIAGLFIKRKTQEEYFFDIWLVSVVLSWAVVPTTSLVHEYYQLPLMLPGVVFIGKFFAKYWHQYEKKLNIGKILTVCLCLSILTGSMIYSIDYMRKERTNKSDVFQLAQMIKQNIKSDSLTIFTTGGDPTLLYLSHRKGWLVNPSYLTEEYIMSKIELGANYLAGSFEFVESYNLFVDDGQKQKINNVLSKYPNIINDKNAFIAHLR
ncbi:glycosyltransferase family 39 protein [Cuspidothrix issatschenkoi LEGE 03284]|uniref:ArnT family glycosyltransferase n=1 Tax=Cuspidothrix issatschenkoi TaxID=230752 RepID=UPI00187FD70D|nr:glycosyltransferase family 39 protein [Cuspidothrix issatschenkoi]MBE9232222.1 glycosyltransferase family 39 protein [Cuspidothrix issatschenkoi LEGE 03284]